MFEFFFDDVVVVELWVGVVVCLVFGVVFYYYVEFVSFEGFQLCQVIFVEVVDDVFEVEYVVLGWDIFVLVVWIVFVDDVVVGVIVFDQVGIGVDGWCQLDLVEGCVLGLFFGEDWYVGDDQWQLMVVVGEIEVYCCGIDYYVVFYIGKD